MIDLSTARERVKDYLLRMERQMSAFGSALQGYKDPHHRLVILKEYDYEFGWVFSYNTEQYVATGDRSYALAGNAPIIVDRADGQLYGTGTAYPLDHFIAEYRRGVRRRAEQIASPEPPLPDSGSSAQVHRPLDWLPAPVSRSGR
ncbi:MAG: hypothetical protein J0M24_28035 [Verrucomicrobia bacterium]|nr:hypothetical protein [Verrucomicrobiota bacterium]